jgi:N-alpha-acetyltransferase 15/16, NatA auxiliary subunit
LFQIVVSCYDKRQYEKGIKTADNILKKFPNHGETQSMKALIYYNLGRKTEGLELAKKGLEDDKMQSHLCFHVLGLIYKGESNYAEVIKCYNSALKISPNNMNILRDLSHCQIQVPHVSVVFFPLRFSCVVYLRSLHFNS